MGLAEFVQGSRAGDASRQRRGTAGPPRPPVVAMRLRPLAAAHNLWANAAGFSSRLGMNDGGDRGGAGGRVEFVTEPKTKLKFPGEKAHQHSSTRSRLSPRCPCNFCLHR